MIYLFQILLVIFYVVFMVKNSNNKKKKRTFKDSKSRYQKMIDKANKAIEKSNKVGDFSNNFNLHKESNLNNYENKNVSKKDKQKELKKELIANLKSRETLLKSNEDKLNKLDLIKENKTIKSGVSSKIIDQRSMESAVEHTDDSIYSNSIIDECELDHSKNDSAYAKKTHVKKPKITHKALREAVIFKEILDKPVSMR